MLCSPAEIEKKRQEALQRLARKSESPIKPKVFRQDPCSKTDKAGCNSPLKTRALQGTSFWKKPYEMNNTESKSYFMDFYGHNKTISAIIILISTERFVVKMSTYSPPVTEILKTVTSKNYGKLDLIGIEHYLLMRH